MSVLGSPGDGSTVSHSSSESRQLGNTSVGTAPTARHMTATPEVVTTPLSLAVHSLATGMQPALARSPQVKLRHARLDVARPPVVSVPFRAPALKTRGFVFPALADWMAGRDPGPATNPAASTVPKSGKTAKARPTRVRPPEDIVKLEDRLFYVLQPPLETWLTGEDLTFAFPPFPYQLEGVAFLYPRHSAMLADEMGLGKTMQAITAIRMLLHLGEARTVLLICPKPLVTNWQREFATWAPEIPVVAIEGDQARRRWQWQLPLPVKIANYELLHRDRESVLEPSNPYDLVVLDESQRIKNQGSNTALIARGIPRSRSWALTGTPIENSAQDLVGIFEFVSPGYLNDQMHPHGWANWPTSTCCGGPRTKC